MPTNNKQETEPEKTEHELAQERALELLGRIGGGRVAEDALRFQGTEIILPKSLEGNPEIARKIIRDFILRDAQTVTFERTFRFRPLDGARALYKALYKAFGTTGRARGQMTFFGPNPPAQKEVSVAFGKSEQIPWGEIQFPMFNGSIYTDVERHKDYGPLFRLVVEAPRRFRPQVEGLFKLVQDQLETESIYRGKAIDGQTEPEFLDLRGVDPSKVIYSDAVTIELEANIWSLLRYTEAMREANLPLKRANLIIGRYGTGKTLAGYLTALLSVQTEWTFIYCRPGKDNLAEVMQTARLYQPCTVFFEDIDTISNPNDIKQDGVTRLLDMFDGIQSKGTELLVVMTTNHPEQIHKAMLRPGRLDAVIPISGIDAHGLEKLVHAVVRPEYIGDSIDYDRIMEVIGTGEDGMETAYVKEAIDRAQRYAMASNHGRPSVLGTEDLYNAARGLLPQLDMMRGAKEHDAEEPLGHAFKEAVNDAVRDTVKGTEVVRRDTAEPWAVLSPTGGNGN